MAGGLWSLATQVAMQFLRIRDGFWPTTDDQRPTTVLGG
jgi:hypothetical protein